MPPSRSAADTVPPRPLRTTRCSEPALASAEQSESRRTAATGVGTPTSSTRTRASQCWAHAVRGHRTSHRKKLLFSQADRAQRFCGRSKTFCAVLQPVRVSRAEQLHRAQGERCQRAGEQWGTLPQIPLETSSLPPLPLNGPNCHFLSDYCARLPPSEGQTKPETATSQNSTRQPPSAAPEDNEAAQVTSARKSSAPKSDSFQRQHSGCSQKKLLLPWSKRFLQPEGNGY